jgi:hypothetical protein
MAYVKSLLSVFRRRKKKDKKMARQPEETSDLEIFRNHSWAFGPAGVSVDAPVEVAASAQASDVQLQPIFCEPKVAAS